MSHKEKRVIPTYAQLDDDVFVKYVEGYIQLYIVKCSFLLGNPVENYSKLSQLYCGNGIAANVRFGHSNVGTSASSQRQSLKN